MNNGIKKNGKPGQLSAFLWTLIPPLLLAIFFVLEIEAPQPERRTKFTHQHNHKSQIINLSTTINPTELKAIHVKLVHQKRYVTHTSKDSQNRLILCFK